MSARSNLGDAPWTPASTDPAVRKIVEDIQRQWAADPTLAFLDAIPIHPTARLIAWDTLRRWAADQRISVSRKVSREMQGDLSQTRHIELELSGELPSYLEGSTRRILVSSVYQRLIRLAIEAHPFDCSPKKVQTAGAHASGEAASWARTRARSLRGGQAAAPIREKHRTATAEGGATKLARPLTRRRNGIGPPPDEKQRPRADTDDDLEDSQPKEERANA